MNLKNKLLIIFILFIIILSFFTCNVFASTSTFSFYHYYTGQTIEFTLNDTLSSQPYYILFLNTDEDSKISQVSYYCSTEEMVIDDESSRIYLKNHVSDYNFIDPVDYNFGLLYYHIYAPASVENFITGFDNATLADLYFTSSAMYSGGMISSDNILFSNYDVYDINDELVFQAPQVDRVVLPGITQVEEIPQVMGQVMRILIPIGLIVFSIGLVIYLMRLVISRVQ